MRIAADEYVYPDLAIVCGEPRFDDDELDTLLNPLVVIEILVAVDGVVRPRQEVRRLPRDRLAARRRAGRA